MAWIEAHQTLNNHPKLKRSARLAGIEQVAMIGYLMRLWWWCLDYAQDGNVTEYQPEDIEDAVDWTGTPGALHKAWLDTGFFDVDSHENGEFDVHVHDWYEYAGRLLDKRAANVHRAQLSRQRARNVRATSAYVAPLPDPTVPNLTIPDPTDQDAPAETAPEVVVEVVLSDAVKAYETHIGQVASYTVAEELKELSATYPSDWVPRAIELAKGKRSPMPYVRSCLRNWQNGDGAPPINGNGIPQKSRLIVFEDPRDRA